MAHKLYDHDKWNAIDAGTRDHISIPLTFGPRGAADARHDLVKSWLGGHNFRGISVRRRGGLHVPDNSDEQIGATHANALLTSQVYWVSPGMCDLLVNAASSVKVNHQLSPDLLPNRQGLCFFASTLAGEGLERDRGHDVPVDAIHWYPMLRIDREGNRHFVLNIDSYAGLRITIGPHSGTQLMNFLGGSEWELGDEVEQVRLAPDDADGREESAIEDRKLLLALMSLIESPGVVDVVDMPMDRPTRRRMERAGMPPDAVRVVYLRGSRAETREAHEQECGRYHHQWIVSGHWRQQPYGPGRSLVRQVWIAPYIKGPSGAPLLTGEKVMALVR